MTTENNFIKIIRKAVGVPIMLGAFTVLSQSWILYLLIFNMGYAIACYPKLVKGFNKIRSKKWPALIVFFLSSFALMAQDYSVQVDAFKQSFFEKNTAKLKPHLSSELKFDPIPIANTPAIMENIVSQLPKLNNMTILESEKGKAKVKYDFEGLGESVSHVFFDDAGKITRIEFVENLIEKEMEAQQKMKERVQLPTFGELAKKHLPTKVEFASMDGLIVDGNLYDIGQDQPVILLCHQAGFNRLEYLDIAPRLNALGYNCMAIDQRSGGVFAGKPNKTFQRAKEKGLATNYLDAQQDMKAAINFLYKKYHKKIIIWGSSYSSSLVLLEAAGNEKVKASISFSPGDYFGKKVESLATIFKKINKPFFVTSSKEEATTLSSLVGNTRLKKNQIQFIPKSDGFHGSKVLWTGQKGAEEYWNALTTFLVDINPKDK